MGELEQAFEIERRTKRYRRRLRPARKQELSLRLGKWLLELRRVLL